MKDYKYWVNGYDEVLGEFSIGFKDFDEAEFNYEDKLSRIKENGGNIELLDTSVISYFDN
jgi:hypothetical protein